MEAIKCVVVGDNDAGKTSLLASFATDKFRKEYKPTVFETQAVTVTIGEELYTMTLCDTSGAEDYSMLRLLRYQNTDVFLVCFSIASQSSYENVLVKWAPELKNHCPGTPMILVGTKLEKRDDAAKLQERRIQEIEPVTHAEGLNMQRKIGAVKFLECSAETGKGVRAVFDEAIIAALEIAVGLPGKFFNVQTLFVNDKLYS